jgi:murein DD-endopeptidase MepM/ murein hydrolase activator NlpD
MGRMINHIDKFLYIWRVLFVGTLFIASLFALSFLLAPIGSSEVQARQASSRANADLANSPNVITSGTVKAAGEIGKTSDSMAVSISSGIQSAASAASRSGKIVARGAQVGTTIAVRGIGGGLMFTGRTVGKGVGLAFSIPTNAVKFVASAPVMSGLIRPSDHVEVPIIDPNSPELHAAIAALPPKEDVAAPATTPNNPGPQWPIHGRVTTEFGVAHWPYQKTHTGLDISDLQPPGTTPIKPFRPGRVIDVIRSNQGLGNHVIVDHGNGVTSVYAHLNSFSVQMGQEITLDTILGFEGTTGASTGTHLHFEIRVNGQAANPRQFIGGQP